MSWLLCDYGNVLSLPQDPAGVARLAQLAGGDDFAVRYWADREAYDGGHLDRTSYWHRVLGRRPGDDELETLVSIDVASWCHLNPAAVAAAERAARRGFRLAILSNAPVEVARAVEALPALAPFSPRLFSCDLGAVKPEPAIYAAASSALGGHGDIVFVDDRAANVAAALDAGFDAHLYEGPAQIDAL